MWLQTILRRSLSLWENRFVHLSFIAGLEIYLVRFNFMFVIIDIDVKIEQRKEILKEICS